MQKLAVTSVCDGFRDGVLGSLEISGTEENGGNVCGVATPAAAAWTKVHVSHRDQDASAFGSMGMETCAAGA